MIQINFLPYAICFAIGVLIFVLLLYTATTSLKEKKRRAAKRAFLLMFLLSAPFLLVWFIQSYNLAFILIGICLLLLVLLLFPFKTPKDICDDYPNNQIDERDTMFSRNSLTPNTTRFEEYYTRKPYKKPIDDASRSEPGLLSDRSAFYNPFSFASAHASFFAVDALKNVVEGDVNPVQKQFNAEEISSYLKKWTRKLGALDVGITKLKAYHFYSYKGRGEDYGKEVKSEHTHALAFTVEMSEEMVQSAPQSPIVMESAQQYLDSARIAVQVAAFLRKLGYSARAHIDGNYQVLCPLVARDSGLGEIGRMGLLMTPKQGPRVRIAVVTTNMELESDRWKKSNSTIDFCDKCVKCADVCPSKSISFKSPKNINGVRRWQINSETCFTYWCKVGTDCGRCMAVCPYSHPDNLLHNFVRWGIRCSPFFRKLAILLDDFFYGRKPASLPLPKWIAKK